MSPALVWFRHDLRLSDNSALTAAIASGRPIIPVFILDDALFKGGASRWWLHYSLASLGQDIPLILRRGDAESILLQLAEAHNVAEIHAARAYEPAMRALDKRVDAALKARGIKFHRHLSLSLFAPEAVRTKTGGYYGVYTPFSRTCFELGVPDILLPRPEHITTVPHVASDRLEDWHLLPTKPDWAGGMRAEWQPGEAGAQKRLHAFLAQPVRNYDEGRNIPGITGTSKLSPHLHWGEISPRTVWLAAQKAGGAGLQTFLKELLWREFSISLLWQHETLATQPIRPEFQNFPWDNDDGKFFAWTKGRTGIPIVDAGMRELWQTGWMHNRVRMIAASFLVKHLLIPWQRGAAWFMDTLVDADEAANSASWQWVAGCGADAAPYFRIFNPLLQGLKFDPEGAYVRRYVPELARLPDKFIHNPWEADPITLLSAGINLGETYPRPIIGLSEGRDNALAAYKRMRNE
jgi:deoxyribodipyrimidine photo-lyase